MGTLTGLCWGRWGPGNGVGSLSSLSIPMISELMVLLLISVVLCHLERLFEVRSPGF